jgi:DNA-binding XRE family transcriptional regulator
LLKSAYYHLPHQLQTLRLMKMKSKKADADSLLTKRELAQKLKVSERTTTNLTNSRMIPVIRMGYIVRYDYVHWF